MRRRPRTAAAARAASTSARPRRSSRRTAGRTPLHQPTSPSSTNGAIPEALRPLIGNRIFGCDDCQLVCPWNKFANAATNPISACATTSTVATLIELFAWSEDEFLRRTEGSAIRRSGHERWLRNIAVALGNAPKTPLVMAALESRRKHASPVVREHVEWALRQHTANEAP
jgi:epoxyqueuosine reductase